MGGRGLSTSKLLISLPSSVDCALFPLRSLLLSRCPMPQFPNMGTFRFLRNFKFQPLASVWTRTHPNEHEDEETKGFLDKGYQENKNGGISRTAIVLTVLNALMLLTSSTWFMIWYCNHFIVLNAALRRTSSYSPSPNPPLSPLISAEVCLILTNPSSGPVWNLVDLEPSVKMLNGTYYPPKSGGSIARQQPNPEADAIWDEWELTRVFPITKEDVLKIGKDPSTVAKLEDDIWGLGDDAYAAIFDSYHQIHCLNSLRHIAYGNYCK